MSSILRTVVPLLLFCFCIAIRSLSSANKPHILFVLVDDLGYTDLGYKQGTEYKTKNLDKLARTGIDLTRYYVEIDCTPTRASMMTGRFSWRTGMQNPTTMPPGCDAHIPFDTPTIAELLKNVGYNTQMIGKWHLGYGSLKMTPTGRGFNDYFGYYNGAEDYYFHNLQMGYDLVHNNEAQKQLNGTYNADSFFNYFDDLLQLSYNKSSAHYTQKPLFMYLSLQTVHAPVEAPPKINRNGMDMTSLYNEQCAQIKDECRRTYCEKIQYIDVYLGELVQSFMDLGLWDDTLMILSTDNGGMPAWNATGVFAGPLKQSCGQNYPLRGGKVTGFEGGVRGLSFVNGGDNVIPSQMRGTVNNGLFSAVDWFPSILSFIGESNSIPTNLDGLNIFDAVINGKAFSREQLMLFYNFDATQEIVVDSIVDGSIIKGDWKYLYGNQPYNCWYPHPPEKRQCLQNETVTDKYLFNITADPYESNNLIEVYPEVAVHLRELIVEDALTNGYVYNYADVTWNASCPKWHNGSWLPWLDDGPTNDVKVSSCANDEDYVAVIQ